MLSKKIILWEILMMKKALLLFPIIVFSFFMTKAFAKENLPGVALTEAATVTPVDLNSGVVARKVSFFKEQ